MNFENDLKLDGDLVLTEETVCCNDFFFLFHLYKLYFMGLILNQSLDIY